MPWLETAPMDERLRFVRQWKDKDYDKSELCDRCGVSLNYGVRQSRNITTDSTSSSSRCTPRT